MTRILRSNGTSVDNEAITNGSDKDSVVKKPAAKEAAPKKPVSKKAAPKKPMSKKLPAKEAAVKEAAVKKAASKKPASKKPPSKTNSKKAAEPEVLTKKLHVIAHAENRAAAVHADNTTPGGPPTNENTKESYKAAAPKRGKEKKPDDITDVSDVETTGELTETDVEGTVKGKRSKRADRSYRDALIGMRKTLNLVPITEDEEDRIQTNIAKENRQMSTDRAEDNVGGEGQGEAHEPEVEPAARKAESSGNRKGGQIKGIVPVDEDTEMHGIPPRTYLEIFRG